MVVIVVVVVLAAASLAPTCHLPDIDRAGIFVSSPPVTDHITSVSPPSFPPIPSYTAQPLYSPPYLILILLHFLAHFSSLPLLGDGWLLGLNRLGDWPRPHVVVWICHAAPSPKKTRLTGHRVLLIPFPSTCTLPYSHSCFLFMPAVVHNSPSVPSFPHVACMVWYTSGSN